MACFALAAVGLLLAFMLPRKPGPLEEVVARIMSANGRG